MPQRSEPKNLALLQTRLGSFVRTHRQRLGITQEELAWRASLHRTYLADVERGVRNVTLRIVGQLAQALNTSVSCLLAGDTPVDRDGGARALAEVLLIEDNSDDVELTLRAFRRSRLRNPIRVITDGATALSYLLGDDRAHPVPGLILLDLHLPKVSGLEVLRQIKHDSRTRSIPVSVMTVSRREADLRECRALGVGHYIMKPVTVEHLGRIATALCLEWALLPSAVAAAAD